MSSSEQRAEAAVSLLAGVRRGDAGATEELTETLYAELRRLAQYALSSGRKPPSLQATELVHEAWLRIAGGRELDVNSRAHFLAVAAKVMRHVLIDRARRRGRLKRGAAATAVTLDTDVHGVRGSVGVIELEASLSRLSDVDPRAAEVVTYRVFGGMRGGEVATVMKLSRATVDRSYRAGRAWLTRELGHG